MELVGIRRRGSFVAAAIAREMEVLEGRPFEINDLDVSGYRDDRDPAAEVPDTSRMTRDITDRDVVLVDDVLFTGRTARAALDALVRYGRPQSVQMAALG